MVPSFNPGPPCDGQPPAQVPIHMQTCIHTQWKRKLELERSPPVFISTCYLYRMSLLIFSSMYDIFVISPSYLWGSPPPRTPLFFPTSLTSTFLSPFFHEILSSSDSPASASGGAMTVGLPHCAQLQEEDVTCLSKACKKPRLHERKISRYLMA